MSDKDDSARTRRGGGCGRFLLVMLLCGSLLLNCLLCGYLGLRNSSLDEELPEKHLWGEASAKDKIAVVRIEGVLMEGMTSYFRKQIEQAAADDGVKAVVVRIDSPGGTVSASDELHGLLTQLRDGKMRKYPKSAPKKIIVSMGAIAASGGYYIAMPGEKIFVEPITLTGSIGVYASLPNVAKFINQHGVEFELIKAGGIKASGSPFHELTPQERQPWQDMVDASYAHFLDVVSKGRPKLTPEILRKQVVQKQKIDMYDDKGNVLTDWLGSPRQVDYVRYRADGGSFTAKEAIKNGLADEIGGLSQAVEAAAAAASVSNYKVIGYEKAPSLLNVLTGGQERAGGSVLEPQRLSNAMSPRLWYLAPQADLAGVLAAMQNRRD